MSIFIRSLLGALLPVGVLDIVVLATKNVGITIYFAAGYLFLLFLYGAYSLLYQENEDKAGGIFTGFGIGIATVIAAFIIVS